MRLRLTLTALFLSASPVFAAVTDACLVIENDMDRLSCYDRALGREAVQTETDAKSVWSVRTETSDFKDTTDVYLSVESDEPVRCGFSGTRRLTLFLRCVENTTALIIGTHCHVASGFHGYGQVEYRIDRKPAVKRNFTDSTNNRSLGLWNGGKSIPVIKSLFGGTSLLVRFTPFNENPVSARFDISGLEQAIAPLRQNCNW